MTGKNRMEAIFLLLYEFSTYICGSDLYRFRLSKKSHSTLWFRLNDGLENSRLNHLRLEDFCECKPQG